MLPPTVVVAVLCALSVTWPTRDESDEASDARIETRLDDIENGLSLQNLRLDINEHAEQLAQSRLDRIERSSESLGSEFAAIRDAWGTAWTSILAFLGISGLGALAGWHHLKRRVDEMATAAIEKGIHAQVEKVSGEIAAKSENDLVRLTQALSLVGAGQYDEALTLFGWDGKLESLLHRPPSIVRRIVECLYRSKDKANKARAWHAARELLKGNRETETMQLFLQIAVAIEDGALEGIREFESSEVAAKDRRSAILAATLYRKVGQLKKAEDLIRPFAERGDDIDVAVAIASVYRDQGRVDDANGILLRPVKKVLSGKEGFAPRGWYTLLNAYVANCLDRGVPLEAVDAAVFMMKYATHEVNAQTAALLLFEIGQGEGGMPASASTLRELVEKQVGGLPDGPDSTKARAWMLAATRNFSEAMRVLDEYMEGLPDSRRRSESAYYVLSACGQISISAGDWETAVVRLEAAQTCGRFNGEAYFYLAVAYALGRDCDRAARWLKEAVGVRRHWVARAKKRGALMACDAVQGVLDSCARGDFSASRDR